MATIEIEDTGPGLTAQEIERIFEPFARGTASAQAAPGAGLGLTIAKMLTDLMGGRLSATSTPGQGSVFTVKLFLPEVHPGAAARPAQPPARVRRAYAGARRKILVVDNEEPDRELLVHLLEPLGFELRTAASGHDCLDLLAAGLRPDAILMDLAMPGIDGWETIRRLRGIEGGHARVAIVSANAFDKGLDNDVGIRAEDFVLKPVRHSELLDWLERQLGLQWLDAAVPPPAAPASEPLPPSVWPTPGRLAALQDVVQLGYYRGIMNQLDQIEAEEPATAALVAQWREHARRFQFEAIGRQP